SEAEARVLDRVLPRPQRPEPRRREAAQALARAVAPARERMAPVEPLVRRAERQPRGIVILGVELFEGDAALLLELLLGEPRRQRALERAPDERAHVRREALELQPQAVAPGEPVEARRQAFDLLREAIAVERSRAAGQQLGDERRTPLVPGTLRPQSASPHAPPRDHRDRAVDDGAQP